MGAPQDLPEDILAGSSIGHALEKSNTTIGIVATNAKLDSKTAKRIAHYVTYRHGKGHTTNSYTS